MEGKIKIIPHKRKDKKFSKAYEKYINQPEVREVIEQEVVKRIAKFLMWGKL